MPLTDWDSVLQTILGNPNVDRKKVIAKPWLRHGGFWDEANRFYSNPSEYQNIWSHPGFNEAHFWQYRDVSGEGHYEAWITRVLVDYYANGSENDYQTYWNNSNKAIYDWPIVNLDKLTFDTAYGAFKRAEEWLTANVAIMDKLIAEVDTESSGFKGSAGEAFTIVLRNIREFMTSAQADMTVGTSTWSALLADNSAAIVTFTNALRTAFAAYNTGGGEGSRYGDPRKIIMDILRQVKEAVDAFGLAAVTEQLSWTVTVQAANLPAVTVDISKAEGWTALDTLAKNAWIATLSEYLDKPMTDATTALENSFTATRVPLTTGLTPPLLYGMTTPTPGPNGGSGGGNQGPGGNLPGADGSGLPDSGSGSGLPDSGGGSGLPESGGGSGLPDFGGGSGLSDFGGGSGLPDFGSGSGLPDLGSGSGLPDLGGGPGVSPLIPPFGSIPVSTVPGSYGRGPLAGGGGSGGRSDDDSGLLSSLLPTAIDGQDIGTLGGAPAPAAGGGGAIGTLGVLGADGAMPPGGGFAAGTGTGMGGMPFMPMGGMGGMGAGGQSKERERTTWLAEDEDVWGTDPDCTPAVIGRDDTADTDAGSVTQRVPVAPYSPNGPRPGTTRTTRRGGG
ncbi:hypothetical protein OHA72_37070 [Dactylosporangium sp. NBC_01737]|uniref:hypothetical protein n=1 Tax=Dactylosporangium sp. NBC_01737 TaxID=2975959 RepID=UPI002E1513C4|nr:hypothetical protein OHA72_37070 [Dactylosporangium sp. NBC_01737]